MTLSSHYDSTQRTLSSWRSDRVSDPYPDLYLHAPPPIVSVVYYYGQEDPHTALYNYYLCYTNMFQDGYSIHGYTVDCDTLQGFVPGVSYSTCYTEG
jgi:hypothetical protein